jgi:hypothetical protein
MFIFVEKCVFHCLREYVFVVFLGVIGFYVVKRSPIIFLVKVFHFWYVVKDTVCDGV